MLFGFAEIRSPRVDLDKWIRRKLRCYQWKQWGRAGYRRLRALGIDRNLAWNTAKSAHGPWRLSKSPALNYAMDAKYFQSLGLPTLARS
jgi:RNA-directed DNA polymerase